jgi:hypothetical protein
VEDAPNFYLEIIGIILYAILITNRKIKRAMSKFNGFESCSILFKLVDNNISFATSRTNNTIETTKNIVWPFDC